MASAFDSSLLGHGAGLPEREQTIGVLERGTVVSKYTLKKTERKTMCIRRETMLIVWTRQGNGRSNFDGAVDIREIKEIRRGKTSKDFDKWSEETRALEPGRCFVVIYGKEFNLKSLSVVAMSEGECEMWHRGLNYLVEDATNASYGLNIHKWLRKSFYEMETPGKEGTITLQELKKFMQRVNCKIATSALKERFNKYDQKSTGEIFYDDFCSLVQEWVFSKKLFQDHFSKFSQDGKRVTLQEFSRFLKEEQGIKEKMENVACIMRDFLQDSSRAVAQPYFHVTEFMDYLFSNSNQILSPITRTVYHDMTRPLSHYFVASSHNTYLTGDQISSESSTEAYARCLRMGCRSVELDCWDGQDGFPFIYHGHTLTSKIKFLDVIKTIKEHAFVTSDYPVILSIEDHCSLPQQRKMASAFIEVFGDSLVTAPIDKNETELPSPEKMRRRIILKHKKLPEGADENTGIQLDNDPTRNMDLSDSIKNGILSMQETGDDEWRPHFFVLTSRTLVYSEVPGEADEEESVDHAEVDRRISTSTTSSRMDADSLHFSESWFHRNLAHGRSTAEQLLKSCVHLGDGTFLVRPSETFVGDYSLSFQRRGEVHHVPIRLRQQESGVTKYYLIDQVYFDSLYDLVTHYQSHPLRSSKFTVSLNKPAPPPNQHEEKPWYHANASRTDTEEMLSKVAVDGAFLVRPGERVAGSFAISFRAENKVKHCLIKKEGRLYMIGTSQFESLVELVAYYEKNPLYRKVRLKLGLSEDVIARKSSTANSQDVYCSSGYMDPNSFTSQLCARAMYDYKARRDDELSFSRGALITNVNQQDTGWWRGDHGGRRQHWFPANFTQLEEPEGDNTPLGNLQKGSVEIAGADVKVEGCVIKVESKGVGGGVVELRAGTREEALEWADKVRETGRDASDREVESRRKERAMRIARELSNLVIYCRSVVYNAEKAARKEAGGGHHMEMSSFSETRAEKIFTEKPDVLMWYHRSQISRVYPKAQRVASDNYSPLPMWAVGSQMIALNYQTGDRPMQLNQAKFIDNGNCGYLLRPQFMFNDNVNPADKTSVAAAGVKPLSLEVRVMAARHLLRPGRGLVSPYVEVEVCGAEYDNVKFKTGTINDNGFNPVFNEVFQLNVANPDMALLRFCVYDEDMFGDPNFLGAATYPIKCLQNGFRSIQLKNNYSEELELSALLVQLVQKSSEAPSTAEEIARLREAGNDLARRALEADVAGDVAAASSLREHAATVGQSVARLLAWDS